LFLALAKNLAYFLFFPHRNTGNHWKSLRNFEKMSVAKPFPGMSVAKPFPGMSVAKPFPGMSVAKPFPGM